MVYPALPAPIPAFTWGCPLQFPPPPCSLDLQQWCILSREALDHESFLAPNGSGPSPPASLYLPSHFWAQQLWNLILFLFQSGSLPILINGDHPSPTPTGFWPLVPPSPPSHVFYWDFFHSLNLPCDAFYTLLLTRPSSGAEANSIRVLPSRVYILPKVYVSGQGQNERVQSNPVTSPNCAQGCKQEVRTGNEWLLARGEC